MDAPERTPRIEVAQLLQRYTRPGTSEDGEDKRGLVDEAVELATEQALRAFLCINVPLLDLAGDGRVRTRAAVQTKTNGIGLRYDTGVGARPTEIQTILLPTKSDWRGWIEAYLRGHQKPPVTAAAHVDPTGETIDGRPVFRVIGKPSEELVKQLVRAFSTSSLYRPR